MKANSLPHSLPKKYSLYQRRKESISSHFNPDQVIRISLNPFSIAKILFIITLALLIASLGSSFLTGIDVVHRFGRLFDVDEEYNIPTAFSIFLLEFAATLLVLIFVINWKRSPLNSVYWLVLAGGFFFMAADEGWRIHEWAGNSAKTVHGFILFSWVLVFIPIVLLLFLFFIKFLMDLPRKTRFLFLLSGIIFVGGAIVMESISAYFFETFGRRNTSYILITTLEEGMEMSGVVLFIYSLLGYLKDHYRKINLNFGNSAVKKSKTFSRISIVDKSSLKTG